MTTSDADRTPDLNCPACDSPTHPDPRRPGWLYCDRCRWPVWMPFDGYYVHTPAPTEEALACYHHRIAKDLDAIRSAPAVAIAVEPPLADGPTERQSEARDRHPAPA